jgi:hypothetical protein
MDTNSIPSKDALDLVQKLFSEKVLVQASLFGPSRLGVRVKGFIVSVTELNGIVVSTERPFAVNEGAWICVPLAGRNAVCSYGDKREYPEAEREQFSEQFGDAILIFNVIDSNERFALTFTL